MERFQNFKENIYYFFFNEKINKNGNISLISREDAIKKIIGRFEQHEKGKKEKEDAEISLKHFKVKYLRDGKDKSYRYIFGNSDLTPVNPL